MEPLLGFAGMEAVRGLVGGVTRRRGGVSEGPYASLNLGLAAGDDPSHVAENARRLQACLGAPAPVRFPRQVHGRTVAVAVEGDPTGPVEADALVTDAPGLAVGVLGADCPGVLVVDPVHRALAVVHAGWRGTVAGVLGAAIEVLATRYGARPRDLRVGLGPGIGPQAYEVGPDVAEPVRALGPDAGGCLVRGRGDRWHLDLHAALRAQALAAGVPAAHVEAIPLCTYRERDLFFSHRRDGPATGRHALVAMWAP